MVEPEQYVFPHKESDKHKQKADPETLAYLESLPWRPIGVEW